MKFRFFLKPLKPQPYENLQWKRCFLFELETLNDAQCYHFPLDLRRFIWVFYLHSNFHLDPQTDLFCSKSWPFYLQSHTPQTHTHMHTHSPPSLPQPCAARIDSVASAAGRQRSHIALENFSRARIARLWKLNRQTDMINIPSFKHLLPESLFLSLSDTWTPLPEMGKWQKWICVVY